MAFGGSWWNLFPRSFSGLGALISFVRPRGLRLRVWGVKVILLKEESYSTEGGFRVQNLEFRVLQGQ